MRQQIGRRVFETHGELRERGGHYAALWRAQQAEASTRGDLTIPVV